MQVKKSFGMFPIAIFFQLVGLSATADDLVISSEGAKQLIGIKSFNEAHATRIEIPTEHLRKIFNTMKDSEERKLPISGRDHLLISRSHDHLDVIAIVDNIGTDVKVRKRIGHFLKATAKGGRVVLQQDEFNSVTVIVIAGNVGTVIDVNLNIDRRRTVIHDDDSDEDGSSVKATDPVAVRGVVHRVKTGQVLRCPGGFSEHNGKTWRRIEYSDTTVTFNKPTYIYAH